MNTTIQTVLQRHLKSYASQHRMPIHHWKAAKALMSCRTAALGGHVQRCERGHISGVWFNSCRHRHCPRCNALKNARWLDAQRAKLIACAHRHVVFTIPSELRVLFQLNEAAFTDALFDAVRKSMLTLVADERYVGGTPGMLLARHTWSRSLALHPHIHCLVTEGGLSKSSEWRTAKKRCFLPARVVMSLYRGKLLHRLRTLLSEEALVLPDGYDAARLKRELYRLSKVRWNVRVGERYGHGVGVATYLARYLNGGPLRDGQVRCLGDNDIRLSYSQSRAEPGRARRQTMRLSAAQFLKRYLLHVPQHRRRLLRGCGLYASASKARLEQARKHHHQAPVSAAPTLHWREFINEHAPSALRCRHCGAPVKVGETLERVRAPPTMLKATGCQ